MGLKVRALVELHYRHTRLPGEVFDCESEDHAKLLTLIKQVERVDEEPVAIPSSIAEPLMTRALSAEDQKIKEQITEPKTKGRYHRMDLRAKE